MQEMQEAAATRRRHAQRGRQPAQWQLGLRLRIPQGSQQAVRTIHGRESPGRMRVMPARLQGAAAGRRQW